MKNSNQGLFKAAKTFSDVDTVREAEPLNPYDSVADDLAQQISEHYESLSFKESNINIASLNFYKEWISSKSLYLNIQITFIAINFLITLALLALSIWINIDTRFVFITHLGNLSYSSLNRIIGLLPLISLLVFSISFFLDLSQFFLFCFVRNFLNSHDQSQINEILNNQKLVLKLNYDTRHLQLRGRIRRQIKTTLTSLNALTYMFFSAYFVFVLSAQFFIALFIHFKFDVILNYQLPATLRKLVKEFEKRQIEFLNKNSSSLIVYFRHVFTKSIEDKLIDEMNTNFQCCNYQNPYQFGELAPASCNYQRGCLKPLQFFTWDFLYMVVLILLITAVLRICLQFVLWMNFKILLIKKLIDNLYEFDLSKYEFADNEEAELEENEKLKREMKFKEIRLQKERQLQEEEEEEERLKAKQEEDYQIFIRQERIQDEYERMLAKQNRFEELKLEKLKRKLQTEHQIVMNQVDDF